MNLSINDIETIEVENMGNGIVHLQLINKRKEVIDYDILEGAKTVINF